MNANTTIALIIALIVGAGGGYLFASTKAVLPEGAQVMSDSLVVDSISGDMHGAMGDMVSGLQGKTGDEFDKAFLAEMVVHHEGAVVMAEAALQHAKHAEVKTMANAIIKAQTAEISQMKGWLDDWYGQ
jgi:uncharacterized protein (DUF305 family)